MRQGSGEEEEEGAGKGNGKRETERNRSGNGVKREVWRAEVEKRTGKGDKGENGKGRERGTK